MKLDQFIRASMEAILADWESFAKTLLPAAGDMSALALRDHARQILLAIALDMETAQSAAEQKAKSEGHGTEEDDRDSAAAIHGSLRHASNFSLLQLSAEFRALRASVLRLWLPQVVQMDAGAADQMVRFNEAIDQALAESVVTYSGRADRTRELFLAILGHDLRAPLANMVLAGELLTKPGVAPEKVRETGMRVRRGARLMSSMVNDLIGYTRTELGAGMPTMRTQLKLDQVLRDAIADASAVHPATIYTLELQGETSGNFDAVRLQQLFTNLMVNAAQHGAPGQPVRILANGDGRQLVISVNNLGATIPHEQLETIFSPLVQLAVDDDSQPRTSLGLGLYVAREIAAAHQGSISVASNDADGTTFRVELPLDQPA